MSVLVVSLLQLLYLIIAFVISNILFGFVTKKSELSLIKVIVVFVSLALVTLNHGFYRESEVFSLNERWADEDRLSRIRRGWLVTALLVLPVVFVICYAVFK